MGLTAERIAVLLTVAGGCLVIAGVALVYIPAAVILAGLAICTVGLLVDFGVLAQRSKP